MKQGETFAKPAYPVGNDEILCFFSCNNEAEKLPYFLDYYRSLGVSHFFAVNNRSTDKTEELLKKQPDVYYFFTNESYADSGSGRLWTSELASHYAQNRWALTVDVDELLVFPGSEFLTLRDLVVYLNQHMQQGLFTVFLDMYGRSLGEAVYSSGDAFLDVCPLFETDSYVVEAAPKFPPIQIFGGPRQRLFWGDGDVANRAAMRKTPLVLWSPHVQYLHSTHSLYPLPLSDVVGATLHFKLVSSFADQARHTVDRGDQIDEDHYRRYVAKIETEEDISFLSEHSLRHEGTLDLLRRGVMTCSPRFLNFAAQRIKASHGADVGQRFLREAKDALSDSRENAKLGLHHLPALWPIVREPYINPKDLVEFAGKRLPFEVETLRDKVKILETTIATLNRDKRQLSATIVQLQRKWIPWWIIAPLRKLWRMILPTDRRGFRKKERANVGPGNHD